MKIASPHDPWFSRRMRYHFLLLALICPVSAQTDSQRLVKQSIYQAASLFAPIPQHEKTAVLKCAAELLAKHVTSRPDGTSSAICTFSGRRQVEWKRLEWQDVRAQAITEADRLNGASKRYLASLSCDAHRSWDAKKNVWGRLQPINDPCFPAAIVVGQKGGTWFAVESDMMKHYIPGPGPSITRLKADAKDDGLPPGMKRSR